MTASTPPPAQAATQKTQSRPLKGQVALVAGATRGAGRGTAVALGEAGATVYCTGRSTRDRRSEYDRRETIQETAELVTAAGGVGIAVAVDHLEAGQVEALVRRIGAESGRLDVLVNDIWGAELLFEANTPLWEHTAGATWSKSRTQAGRPTRPATAERRDENVDERVASRPSVYLH